MNAPQTPCGPHTAWPSSPYQFTAAELQSFSSESMLASPLPCPPVGTFATRDFEPPATPIHEMTASIDAPVPQPKKKSLPAPQVAVVPLAEWTFREGAWTRQQWKNRTANELLYEWILDPDFWHKWRGGAGVRKDTMYKEFNEKLRLDGFRQGRSHVSIEAKIRQVKKDYEKAVTFKKQTGAGVDEDDLWNGKQFKDVMNSKCAHFYELHEVVKTRISFAPQAQHSTGDEYDHTLEVMKGFVDSLSAPEPIDNIDSDDDHSDASNTLRAGARASQNAQTVALPQEQDDIDALGFAIVPDSQTNGGVYGVLSYPSNQKPALTSSGRAVERSDVESDSGRPAKRPRTVAGPTGGKQKRDLVEIFLETQARRLEFDQQVHKQTVEDKQREREVWLEEWKDFKASGGNLEAFVVIFGPRP